jgi:hypothetical protein
MARNTVWKIRGWLTLFAALSLATQTGVAAQEAADAPATPCLQELQAERANPTPKKKKSNAGAIFGAILGGAAGALLGSQLCGRDRGLQEIGSIVFEKGVFRWVLVCGENHGRVWLRG